MNYGNARRGALQQYTQVRAHSSVEDVTPHRLIQLLMEGAIEKINLAKGHMLRGEIEAKVNHIDWAISILEGLQVSLDMEKGGQIAENLHNLYDYMQHRLIFANMENTPALLDEVSGLLSEIKQGWDAIPEEIRRLRPEEIQNASTQVKTEKK